MNAKDAILARRMGGGGGGGGVQSDWNINDETDPAYIKNRPFYSEETYTEILPEQAVAFEALPEMGLLTGEVDIRFLSGQAPFALGDTLTITFDGNAYNCVARELEGIRALFTLGNAGVLGGDFEDTGEPFFIMGDLHPSGEAFILGIYAVGTSTNHTIEILKVNEQIVPVPEKFLPKDKTPMRVEITGNDTDGYSANCSKAEIMAAYNSGKFVYAVYPYSVREYLFYLSSPPKNGYDYPAVFRSHDFYQGYVNYTTSAFFAIYDEGVEFIDVMVSGIVLKSSESDKRFEITVNDSGTLTATEVT